MDTQSTGITTLSVDAREFLTVVGVAVAGLLLAAAAAFTPWYGHGGDAGVIEVHGPVVAPAAPAARR